jgi:hypothetical protein
MPVQFRCSACRGKLSISRRKAGKQVECPKCGQTLTVPTGEAMADELTELLVAAQSAVKADVRPMTPAARLAAKRPATLEDMPLFERPDFEKLLDPVAHTPDPTPLPLPLPDDRIPDRSRSTLPPGHDPDAIVLSRTTATLLVVAVVVLLGLAFAAGFLVGG